MYIVVGLGACLLSSGSGVHADTFKCDAVDALARLGYNGNDRVSIIGKDKICKFSIGGASADALSPPSNVQQTRDVQEMLFHDPQSFVSQRLGDIARESAEALGDTATFVMGATKDNSELSQLSCSSLKPIVVDNTEIRCLRFDDASYNSAQTFKNGVITAQLFRPTFAFEFYDKKTSATAMVIFIPRPPR